MAAFIAASSVFQRSSWKLDRADRAVLAGEIVGRALRSLAEPGVTGGEEDEDDTDVRGDDVAVGVHEQHEVVGVGRDVDRGGARRGGGCGGCDTGDRGLAGGGGRLGGAALRGGERLLGRRALPVQQLLVELRLLRRRRAILAGHRGRRRADHGDRSGSECDQCLRHRAHVEPSYRWNS
jgi:hypothetical protein